MLEMSLANLANLDESVCDSRQPCGVEIQWVVSACWKMLFADLANLPMRASIDTAHSATGPKLARLLLVKAISDYFRKYPQPDHEAQR